MQLSLVFCEQNKEFQARFQELLIYVNVKPLGQQGEKIEIQAYLRHSKLLQIGWKQAQSQAIIKTENIYF